MAIYSEIGAGQRLYLENQGDRTIVTLASSGAGQQQQATTGFQTGAWTAEPQIYQTSSGIIVTVIAASGNNTIQIQGTSARLLTEAPTLISATRLPSIEAGEVSGGPSMEPMKPMQPLKMGDMEMSFQPMQMRMGNMSMSMGETTAKRQFCSQCGAKVAESDRFCSSCGHQLS